MSQAPLFDAWLDDFFAVYYRHLPVNATFIGIHDHDHRLPDWSSDGLAAFVADIQSLQGRLAALPSEDLSTAQALDRRLAAGYLAIQTWELASDHCQRGNPALYTGEAVFGIMGLFLRPFAPIAQRVDAAVQRLHGVGAFLDQARANIPNAPCAWTERAIGECEGARHFCLEGVDRLIAAERIEGSSLRQAADNAAEAFAAFAAWLQADLMRRPRHDVGVGAEILDLHIKQAHFLPASAKELLAGAEEVFAEHRARLEAGAVDFGAATWQEALAGLADLHPTSPNEYYTQYERMWQACKDLSTAHDLVTWQALPIQYTPRPVWARTASPALYFLFYRSPAPFDPTPVVDYLVEPIEPEMPADQQERLLRTVNDSVIKLNHVVHHGCLGHHVQNTYAFQAESRIGRMAAVDCASRIAMLCGGTMAEGWSCYTTELVGEFGFLTPLETYSENYARMRMAARTIVDIKLHCGDFDLAAAVNFYTQEVGMSATAAQGEATKNSMFPGGALMYLSGVDTIYQLRRELAATQGDAFSLRQFHDRFLSYGSVPVALIAEAMRQA